MADRKNISKKTRFEVFKRDGFKCLYCGKSAPDVVLVIDHIEPVSKGGADQILNYATSCVDCNAGKSDRRINDHSILSKQVNQLQQLNEKREQLDMLIEWKQGLSDLQDEAVDKVCEYWWNMTEGFHLSEFGRKSVKSLIKKHTVSVVLDKMQEASEKLERDSADCIIRESVEKTFDFMKLLCNTHKLYEQKPYMRDVFYIRGIIRRRFNWMPADYQVAAFLEGAILGGVLIDELKNLSRSLTSWNKFEDVVEAELRRLNSGGA
jgi:hypothetical protein